MTKQEILDGLEALKDSTNNAGKLSIDGIKAAIFAWPEAPPLQPEGLPEAPPEPEVREPEPEKIVPRKIKSKNVTKYRK